MEDDPVVTPPISATRPGARGTTRDMGPRPGSSRFLDERDWLLGSRKLYNWSHRVFTCPSLCGHWKDLLALVGSMPCSLACPSSHITRHLPQPRSAFHDPVVTAPVSDLSTFSRGYLRVPSVLCLGCVLHSATAAGNREPSRPLQPKMLFWYVDPEFPSDIAVSSPLNSHFWTGWSRPLQVTSKAHSWGVRQGASHLHD